MKSWMLKIATIEIKLNILKESLMTPLYRYGLDINIRKLDLYFISRSIHPILYKVVDTLEEISYAIESYRNDMGIVMDLMFTKYIKEVELDYVLSKEISEIDNI